jgi:multidrug efflux pump subunit AcrB
MRTDIFPEIDIPVVTTVWTYRGMEAEEFEKRITTFSEYAMSSNVNDIQRMESQTVNGVSVVKIYFHPGTDVNAAISQVTAVSQAIRQIMPPSVQPPIILRFNASSVPILQLGLNPGMVETEGMHSTGIAESDFRKQIEATTPLGRIGQPGDIAPAAVYLASSDSAWITGETLLVAGGLH